MGNDPINNADPSGGFSVSDTAIGAGIGLFCGMAYAYGFLFPHSQSCEADCSKEEKDGNVIKRYDYYYKGQ